MRSAFARRLVEHRLTLLTGLAAALPVIVSTIRALSAGWVPLGDDAVIATKALDVLTLHPPLLGQVSASSAVLGETVYSPGPMLYWLLAIPARIGPAAMVIAIGLSNTAAVAGSVALARRRGGLPLMFASAVAIALMCGSLRAEVLHSVWNPYAALLPLVLLCFLAWSVACGEHRLLPLTVVVASFVLQCHLTFVAPVLGLLAVAVVGLVMARRRASDSIRPWLMAALAAGLVCWSLPLADQAVHRPGNVVALAKSAGAAEAKLGADAGWRAVVRAVGVPPWWLRPPRKELETLDEVALAPPLASQLSAALVLFSLLAAIVLAARRRRADVMAVCAIALALSAGLAAVAASTPTTGILVISVGYTLRWGAIAGMWAWLALGWSAFALLRPRLASVREAATRLSPGVATGVALIAVAATGVVVASRGSEDRLRAAYEPLTRITARIDAELPDDRHVEVDRGTGESGFDYRSEVAAAVAHHLRRRGTPVTSAALGGRYARAAPAGAAVLRVSAGHPPPPGALLLGRALVPGVDVDLRDGQEPPPSRIAVFLLQTGR